MSELHRRPSMPRVAWLERDRVAPPPPPSPPPEPPVLFRPKSPVREKLFPPARPIAKAVRRVAEGSGVRLVLLLAPPVPRRPTGEEPPAPAGRDWLRLAPPRRRGTGVSVGAIIAMVAEHYDVAPEEILAHRRTAHLVIPRQVAMYLAKLLTTHSLPELGRRFAGRDHTTILHAVRKVTALIGKDADLADEVAELAGELAAGARRTPEPS